MRRYTRQLAQGRQRARDQRAGPQTGRHAAGIYTVERTGALIRRTDHDAATTMDEDRAYIAHDMSEPAAIPEDRRRSIADMLLATGAVSVAQVESRFNVSAMTARRDLHELERRGLARRTHGGAVLPTLTAHEDSFDRRIKVDTNAKQLLASAAAQLLNPHETVFLDSSTTSHFVARRIIDAGIAATILTNSLPIMTLISTEAGPNVELIGVGGTLRALTRSFVGAGATRTVTEHYADRLFLSVKGVVDGDTLTDADPLEADVKRKMIAHARDTVLLIDGSKLDVRGLSAIAPLSDIRTVLAIYITTDQAATLERSGTTVRIIGAKDLATGASPP